MSSLCFSVAAWANDSSQGSSRDITLAEQYAARAFEAYGRRAYDEALALYEKAYGAAPSADILYNMARVYDLGLGLPSRAIEYYRRYREAPEAESVRAEKASRRIAELEVQQTPVRAVESVPSPAPARTEMKAATTSDGWSSLEIAAVATSGVGALGVGIGVGYLLAAHAENDAWKRACDGNECNSAAGVEAAQSAERKANIATLGFAAGGALIAVGATLWVLELTDEHPTTQSSRLRVSPVATASAVGAVFSGAF